MLLDVATISIVSRVAFTIRIPVFVPQTVIVKKTTKNNIIKEGKK